ncbi:MAG: carboxypeptidase-like regulatory domain-containing protein, partial [Bacteroidetes bacterium]|nr:carboxypeptidase-like regulatory domain-containing protein [Bacteroidota bacterium]
MSKQLTSIPFSKWPLLFFGFILFSVNTVLAQATVIKGKVSDANGPLAGATVSEKGATSGVTTDAEGNFKLSVSSTHAIIVISYIGYANDEVALRGRTFINETLQSGNSNTLSGVVVTALGITRNKRSLGYDV